MSDSAYIVLICPVCMKQVEDLDEGCGCWHKEYGGDVEAVSVAASVDPLALHAACIERSQELEEQKAAQAKRDKEREAWQALPKEERERIEAERWEKMTPLEKAVHGMMEDSVEAIKSQLHSDRPLLDQIGNSAHIPVESD